MFWVFSILHIELDFDCYLSSCIFSIFLLTLILHMRLLLWLLPKYLCGKKNNDHARRNVVRQPKSRENHVFQVRRHSCCLPFKGIWLHYVAFFSDLRMMLHHISEFQYQFLLIFCKFIGWHCFFHVSVIYMARVLICCYIWCDSPCRSEEIFCLYMTKTP